MTGKPQLGSLRERVARAMCLDCGLPWNVLSATTKAEWLSNADTAIPIIAEACARVPDQRDPEKPGNYLFPRKRIGDAIRGLFIGAPDDDE